MIENKMGRKDMVRVPIPPSFLLTTMAAVSLGTQQQPGRATTHQGYAGLQPGFIVLEDQAAGHVPMELVLAVDGDPNPHGWYFTAPTFEDHTVEGQWTDDGMVLDGKNGERLSLKYMREHSSAQAGEPLSLYVITTLSGSWFLPAGEQPLTLTISSWHGPLENGRWYGFGASDIEIEKNAQAFLRAIEEGNPHAAARHVDFPLTTLLGKQTVKIRNAQEFLRLYDRILPPGTSERARMVLLHDMFVHRGNAIVLNGGVWFSAKGAVSIFFSRMPPKTQAR